MLGETSGFRDPGRDAQSCFRAAMEATARPGTVGILPGGLVAPPPLARGSAALALALCDYETALWLDDALAACPPVVHYLRFHTGARITSVPAEAAFAIAADPARLPGLDTFGLGTPDYPDRSTTLILQVESLDDASGWSLEGPGIAGRSRLRAGGIGADLIDQRQALARHFPCGIDILFVAGSRVAALPRSTRVER